MFNLCYAQSSAYFTFNVEFHERNLGIRLSRVDNFVNYFDRTYEGGHCCYCGNIINMNNAQDLTFIQLKWPKKICS